MTRFQRPLHRFVTVLLLPICLARCASHPTGDRASGDFTADQLAVMELEFDAFDQDLEGGWRAWAQRDEYVEAARMLDHYAAAHDELDDFQHRIIRFHAGQMYGYAGNSDIAVERFREALNADEPADAPFKWNAYVEGTIAFLERDLETLQRMRAILDTQPERERPMPDGTVVRMKPNLHVLDRFIEHFDRSYREAYSGNVENSGD